MTFAIPARIAVLADPKSKRRGVGPEAVERLLGAWLGNPVVLGHREDGSPLVTGADGHHISIGHALGATAIALADQKIGIDITALEINPADRRVALNLFLPRERAWLDALPREQYSAGFAQLWTLKEAVLKRDRRGLDRETLPDLTAMLTNMGTLPPLATIAWHPWAALEAGSSPGVPASGLMLAMPVGALAMVGAHQAALAQFASPAGNFALAVAWTKAAA